MIKYFFVALVVLSSTLAFVFSGGFFNTKDPLPEYATWYGTGPDKWASIWLISRHISPGSPIELFPEGYAEEGYIYFDTDNAKFNRDATMTSYRKLLSSFNVDNNGAKFIDIVLHDIDISIWQAPKQPLSPLVEMAFRELQTRFGRSSVPAACYLEFFDNLYSVATLNEPQQQQLNVENLLPAEKCSQDASVNMGSTHKVPELPVTQVIHKILAGQKVLFVDVREAQEFSEGHIPGAINLKIRDVNADLLMNASFAEADLIIPYCVKDFRGYEMAIKLKQLKQYNVALLQPYGLKGWVQGGFPLSTVEINEFSAKDILQEFCTHSPSYCRAGEG